MTMLTEGQPVDGQAFVSNDYAEYASPDVTTAADAMLSLRHSKPQSLNMNIHYGFLSDSSAEPYCDDQREVDNMNTPNSQITNNNSGPSSQRKEREFIPDAKKDKTYWVKRHKNNEAAKRSREKRRMNDAAMGQRLLELTNENTRIRQELETLKRRFGIPLDQPILPDDTVPDSPRQERVPSGDNVQHPLTPIKSNGNVPSAPPELNNFHNSSMRMPMNVSTSAHQNMPRSSSDEHACKPPPPPSLIRDQRMAADSSYTSNSTMPALIPLITMSANSYTGNVMHVGSGTAHAENPPQTNSYTGSMGLPVNQEPGRDHVSCEGPVISTVQSLPQHQYHLQGGPSQTEYYPENQNDRHGLPSRHYSEDSQFPLQSTHYQEDSPSSMSVNCYQDNRGYNDSRATCMSYSNEQGRKGSLDSSCESPGRLQICYSPTSESNPTKRRESCESPLNLTKRKRKRTPSDGNFDSSDSEQDDEQKRFHNSYFAYATNGNMPLKFRHKINSTEHLPQECSEADLPQDGDVYSRRNSQGSVFSDDNSSDTKYFDRRRRNNMAAKKCRENRRTLHDIRIAKSTILESENSQLREELQNLTHEVSQLKCLVEKKRHTQNGAQCE